MSTPLRARRSQAGQSIVLVAVIMLTLLTGAGVAFDASYDYYFSILAQRAAAAAALAGVVFVPDQLKPADAAPGCTPAEDCDATDRAIAVADRKSTRLNSSPRRS